MNSLSLGEYIRSTCDRNVYDYLVCTLAHDDDDLDILVSYVDILPGDSFRLKQVVTDMNADKKCVSTAVRVPIVQVNGSNTGTAAWR